MLSSRAFAPGVPVRQPASADQPARTQSEEPPEPGGQWLPRMSMWFCKPESDISRAPIRGTTHRQPEVGPRTTDRRCDPPKKTAMSDPLISLESLFEQGMVEASGLSPKQEPLRRAFISAPLSVDTGLLREALLHRGIKPYELDEVGAEGRTIPDLLHDCVGRADLVIGVLGGSESGGGGMPNVLFELGYASALGKRLLVLVPPRFEMPEFIEAIPYLRAEADNREAINFGLDRLLSLPLKPQRDRGGGPRQTVPIGPAADSLIARFAEAAGDADEQVLTEIVLEALRESSTSSATFSSGVMIEGGRADFAVWSDDFEPWLGNPVLVEVRSRVPGAEDLGRAAEQITGFLDRTGTVWGLLLYGHGPDRATTDLTLRGTRLLAMAIEQFLDGLRTAGLGDMLVQMRNMRVHGKG